ncbi:hypothetical protein AHFPHNDE_01833 [Pseudomonas sp. MM227]|nr:hypothetical protein AHFPHNDE_01833 [Pseudomonas sp. MM227]
MTGVVTAHDEQGNRSAIIFLVFTALLAGLLFPLTGSLAGTQDGDGVLTALISTQQLTWYFWGQDRLLNIFPAIAAPIQDVEWNLHFQIFLRSLCAYLAPLGVLVFIQRNPRVLAAAVAITNIILIVSMSQYAQFNVYVQHNTFGISLVLFAVSYLVFWSSLPAAARWVLILLICSVAYATNYALLMYSIPAIIGFGMLRLPEWRRFASFFAINCVAVLIAKYHAQAFGDPSTAFGLNFTLEAYPHAFAVLAENLNLPVLSVCAVIAIVCFVSNRQKPVLEFLGVALLAVAMFILLCGTQWLQTNAYNIRYYITCGILLTSLMGYAIAVHLVERKRPVGFLCIAGLVACLFIPLGGFKSDYDELVNPRWRQDSKEIAKVAHETQARFVIGGFWDVWPTVFEAEELRDGEPQMVYGGAFRGHALTEEILESLRKEPGQNALCFLPEVQACLDELKSNLRTAPEVSFSGSPATAVSVAGKQMIEFKVSVN